MKVNEKLLLQAQKIKPSATIDGLSACFSNISRPPIANQEASNFNIFEKNSFLKNLIENSPVISEKVPS